MECGLRDRLAAGMGTAGDRIGPDAVAGADAAQPDYEQEKLRFQRGSMLYYALPRLHARAGASVRARAERGDAQAQVALGWQSESGSGVAQQRSAQAEFLLGLMHYQGKGMPQDFAQARHWFEQAAAQGDAGARYNLGVMALGQGGPREPLTAYRWFRLAQLASYPGVAYNLAQAAAELTPAQKDRAERWVRHWQAAHPARHPL